VSDLTIVVHYTVNLIFANHIPAAFKLSSFLVVNHLLQGPPQNGIPWSSAELNKIQKRLFSMLQRHASLDDTSITNCLAKNIS